MRNDGAEPLRNIRVGGTVNAGEATLAGLDCTFPGGAAGTVWSGPFEVGAEFTCTAGLGGVTAGSPHASTFTVAAVGATSGHEVRDEDAYHAAIPGAQPAA